MTIIRHVGSNNVNFNDTVFLTYLEDFGNSALMRVVVNVVVWRMCDALLCRSYEHSVMCSMKSESLAFPFANKEYVRML
jgi:hypothetical protein